MMIIELITWLFRLIDLYTWVLVIYALMSWVPAIQYSKIGEIITRISEPYVSIFRQLPLRFGGLDLSVFVALISLQVIERFIVMVLQWIL